jgi:geranylgeranyl transferase type-1 subunit beta
VNFAPWTVIQTEMATLNTAKQVAYNRYCLALLPTPYTANDLNRMSLGFFILNSLDILDQLSSTATESQQHWIEWIYKCQVPSGGFSGSTATKTNEYSLYDVAHLPATYFAIALLLILGDDLKRVNRQAILEELRKSQNEDGSFSPVLLGEEKFGENDVRHVYAAIAVRYMLSPIKPEEDINVPASLQYIQRCKVFP